MRKQKAEEQMQRKAEAIKKIEESNKIMKEKFSKINEIQAEEARLKAQKEEQKKEYMSQLHKEIKERELKRKETLKQYPKK